MSARLDTTGTGPADYFLTAVPEPFQVLGLQLRPLSLGRYRLLHRFQCAFVADGEQSATMGDLIIGALICSMPVEEFLDWAKSPDFARDVRAWGRHVSPWPWVGRLPGIGKWWRRHWSFSSREKLILFGQYITDGSTVPLFWDETSSGVIGGGHWSQGVEVALRGEVGWSKQEIDEEPLSKALADYCKWLETKGAIRLMTDEEIASIERAKEAPPPVVMVYGRPATAEEMDLMAAGKWQG
jgi:hypothetical protein